MNLITGTPTLKPDRWFARADKRVYNSRHTAPFTNMLVERLLFAMGFSVRRADQRSRSRPIVTRHKHIVHEPILITNQDILIAGFTEWHAAVCAGQGRDHLHRICNEYFY